MCGIAGIVSVGGQPVDDALLRAMTGVLAHRGPDGDGFHVDDEAGLGHRRLAIIDLATGAQPMASVSGNTWIVYNGEIYNFRELRQALQARGHRFATTSDTEVILAAYETWGTDCVARLRGMFALAIWDAKRRRLFLARDRFGIKPLVYAWDGQRLLFASEIKGILQDEQVSRELDWEALRDYLTYHYVPSPKTIFRAIRKLPPASYLVLDAQRGAPEIHRYWDLRFAPDENRSEGQWLEELRWHLGDAVRSHLVSDVPVGAFLSGGVDSSSVVALMAREGRGRVRTFSVGFEDADFDELAHARRVAQRYGTDHFELVVKPDALQALPRLAWELDEPFADSSALPTYHVARITREHVTVALSGDGGDEAFAGYSRYARAAAMHQRFDRVPGSVARPLLRHAARLLPHGVRGQGYLSLLGADPIERYFRMMTFQRSDSLRRLLTAEAAAHVAPRISADHFRTLAHESGAPDYVSTLQALDYETYLPDDILAKVDRTSMMVSLESRVPLLDHVLVEFAATMPSRFKLRGQTGKYLLKRAMTEMLPGEILHRRKMGFGAPIARWFRSELGEYAREILLDDATRRHGLVDPVAVAEILGEHQSGRADRSAQIWAVLCLELWCHTWWNRS